MKLCRLVLTVACLSLICSLFSCVGFGLDQNEARVTMVWSDETPSPGNLVTVTVMFINDSPKDLSLYYFGLNFDWMESDQFVGHDLSDDPVTVQANGGYQYFSAVTVQIPEDATVGAHSYFVGIDGFEGDSDVFSWDSPTKVVSVVDSWQEIYTELVAQVAINISDVEAVDYNSPEAQSFLAQAQYAYSQALTYANQQNWEDAISSLQSSSLYLEQANTEEANYVEPEPEQDLLLIILGVVAVAVAVIVVVIFLMRKKPKT